MNSIIKKIEVFPISIPRKTPYLGSLDSRNRVNEKGYFIRPGNKSIYHVNDQSVLVKVTAQNGVYGWGECVAFVAPQVTVALFDEILIPLTVGKDPNDVVMIYEDLYDAMRVRGFFGGYYHDALAALDIAIWDLRAKLVNLPLCKLFGAQRKSNIPAYVSGLPEETREKRAELAKDWVAKGFNAIKFAAVVADDGEVPEMRSIRKAVGSECRILVDMHWKYTAAEAIKLIEKLDKYDLYLAEAPVQPEDIEGQSKVAASVKTSVGIGEELRTIYEYRPRFVNGCMNVIQPEMGRTGITSFMKICNMAQGFHCQVMPHGSIGIGIFLAASLHATATLPNVPYHEYQHSIVDENQKYLNGNIECRNGCFVLPHGLGTGVEPAEEVFQYVLKEERAI